MSFEADDILSLFDNNTDLSPLPNNTRSFEILASKGAVFLVASTLFFFVVVFGVIGNALLVRIMLRSHSVHRSYEPFLVTLAVTDSGTLLAMTADTIDEFCHYSTNQYLIHQTNAACRIHIFSQNLLGTLSAWLLVCITGERFLVVFYPLKGRMWWRKHRLVVFLLVLLACIAIHTPSLFFTEREPSLGNCQFRRANPLQIVLMDTTLRFGVVYGLPGCLLLVLNCLIILRMHGRLLPSPPTPIRHFRCQQTLVGRMENVPEVTSAWKSLGEKARRDRKRATCILVLISATYVVFLAPQYISHVYWALTAMLSPHESFFPFFRYYMNERFVYQLISALSYSSNFYTYLAFGRRFRKELSRFLASSSSNARTHAMRPVVGHALQEIRPVLHGDATRANREEQKVLSTASEQVYD